MKDSFEKKAWHRLFRHVSFLLAVEAVIVTLLSYYTAFYFSQYYGFQLPQAAGLWCAISGIVVLQVTIDDSIKAGWFRILGSFLGALSSFIFTCFFGFTILALACSMFLTVILASSCKIKHIARLACLTSQVIIIVGMIAGNVTPWAAASARFIESAVGIVIAIAVSSLFFPLRKKMRLLDH